MAHQGDADFQEKMKSMLQPGYSPTEAEKILLANNPELAKALSLAILEITEIDQVMRLALVPSIKANLFNNMANTSGLLSPNQKRWVLGKYSTWFYQEALAAAAEHPESALANDPDFQNLVANNIYSKAFKNAPLTSEESIFLEKNTLLADLIAQRVAFDCAPPYEAFKEFLNKETAVSTQLEARPLKIASIERDIKIFSHRLGLTSYAQPSPIRVGSGNIVKIEGNTNSSSAIALEEDLKIYQKSAYLTEDNDKEYFNMITEAAIENTQLTQFPQNQILDRIRCGNMTLISACWRGHTIGVSFYKDNMIISNRGEGKDANFGVLIYKINPKNTKINANFIEKIRSNRYDQKTVTDLIHSIIEPPGEPIKIFDQKEHKRGTCTYVNPKSAIVGMLYLLKVEELESNRELALTKEVRQEIKQRATDYAQTEYKKFTRFMRDESMDELILKIKNEKIPEFRDIYINIALRIVKNTSPNLKRYKSNAKTKILRMHKLIETLEDVEQKNPGIIKKVLDSDQEFKGVGIKESYLNPAYRYASYMRNTMGKTDEKMMENLLKRGANPNAVDYQGLNAHDYAEYGLHHDFQGKFLSDLHHTVSKLDQKNAIAFYELMLHSKKTIEAAALKRVQELLPHEKENTSVFKTKIDVQKQFFHDYIHEKLPEPHAKDIREWIENDVAKDFAKQHCLLMGYHETDANYISKLEEARQYSLKIFKSWKDEVSTDKLICADFEAEIQKLMGNYTTQSDFFDKMAHKHVYGTFEAPKKLDDPETAQNLKDNLRRSFIPYYHGYADLSEIDLIDKVFFPEQATEILKNMGLENAPKEIFNHLHRLLTTTLQTKFKNYFEEQQKKLENK